MIIHSCEYTHVNLIFMSTFKRLSQIKLEIYKVGHQKRH
jgi:hypothetical protein